MCVEEWFLAYGGFRHHSSFTAFWCFKPAIQRREHLDANAQILGLQSIVPDCHISHSILVLVRIIGLQNQSPVTKYPWSLVSQGGDAIILHISNSQREWVKWGGPDLRHGERWDGWKLLFHKFITKQALIGKS